MQRELYENSFKILRLDILSKLFFKITLMEIFNFSHWYSHIKLGFQFGNKYFWNFQSR